MNKCEFCDNLAIVKSRPARYVKKGVKGSLKLVTCGIVVNRVQMHHNFGLRFLIDFLHAHVFCSFYHEVQKLKTSSAVAHGTDVHLNPTENHVI